MRNIFQVPHILQFIWDLFAIYFAMKLQQNMRIETNTFYIAEEYRAITSL